MKQTIDFGKTSTFDISHIYLFLSLIVMHGPIAPSVQLKSLRLNVVISKGMQRGTEPGEQVMCSCLNAYGLQRKLT